MAKPSWTSSQRDAEQGDGLKGWHQKGARPRVAEVGPAGPKLFFVYSLFTIWLFNNSPWKITMLFIGKPSISIRAIYTMAM